MMKRSKINQPLYSRMLEVTGTTDQSIKIVITNTLHMFNKVEKNYKRKNGRKGSKRNPQCSIHSVKHTG